MNTVVSRILAAIVLLSSLAACGGDDGPSGPDDPAPEITVSGVDDGATVTGPVTITIDVDRGTWEAELNGEPFLSGQTVEAPGSYLLRITAANGDAVSTLEISFEIVAAGDSRLIVRVFDLGANDAGGGGDAILVTDSSATGYRHALIDAGPAGAGASDPGFVARLLQALGVDTLELLLLTHAHSDHFDGIPAVLSTTVVETFVYNGQERTFDRYDQTVAQASAAADQVLIPDAETEVALGFGSDATVLTLVPPLGTFLSDPGADGSEINEGSIGTRVRKGPARVFLTGDGEVRANQRWRLSFPSLTEDVDVLKVGHHGANDAVFDNGFNGSSAWLGHTSPAIGFVTANGTTHPRLNAVGHLLGLPQLRLYCTNVHGRLELRVEEDGSIRVTVERNAQESCEAGSEAES